MYYISGGIGGGGFGGGGWVAVVMVVAEAAAVEVVEEEAAWRRLALPPTQVILRFLHRAEHRTNAFATVPADTDTRPRCWILSSGFFFVA